MPAESSLPHTLPAPADSLLEKEKHLWGHPVHPPPEVEDGRAFLHWKPLTRGRKTVWPATNVTSRTYLQGKEGQVPSLSFQLAYK